MTFPDGTPDDMDRAVASARAAFDTGPWPRLSPQERGEMLLKVSAVLQRRRALGKTASPERSNR